MSEGYPRRGPFDRHIEVCQGNGGGEPLPATGVLESNRHRHEELTQGTTGVVGKLLEQVVLEPRVAARRVRLELRLVVPVPAGG
jgi:hypothetical protein